MSLDISIKANIPVVKNGTGIFIRENGKTKELTIEEANANGFSHILYIAYLGAVNIEAAEI